MHHSDRWLDSVRRECTFQHFLAEPGFIGRKVFAASSPEAIRNSECDLRVKNVVARVLERQQLHCLAFQFFDSCPSPFAPSPTKRDPHPPSSTRFPPDP